jgi:hypothetical protein
MLHVTHSLQIAFEYVVIYTDILMEYNILKKGIYGTVKPSER